MKRHIFSILFLLLNYFSPLNTFCQTTDSDGIISGHEYVDLGLPSGTLWATCNLGTTSPYENGPYFAWGEVEPRDYFSWETYKFFEGFYPYEGGWWLLEDIGEDICGTEYDAATHQWGGGWRMPNETERYELRMRCWSEWTTEKGINGVRVHGPNEHSIFLPACGYGEWPDEISQLIGVQGGYWIGVGDPEFNYEGKPIEPSNMAKGLFVDSASLSSGGSWKATGKNIRAVINPKDAGITGIRCDGHDIAVAYRDGCVTIEDGKTVYGVILHDLSGRKVFSGMTEAGTCAVPSLSSGIYLLTLTNGGAALMTERIVVK